MIFLTLGACESQNKKTERAVLDVLSKKLVAGWQEKNIDLYTSAFWKDDFTYHSDMGTQKTADDVSVTDFNVEIKSQKRIFDEYTDLTLQLSNLTFDPLPDAPNTVQVRADYVYGLTKVFHQGREYPRGTVEYTFKKRHGEWKITR